MYCTESQKNWGNKLTTIVCLIRNNKHEYENTIVHNENTVVSCGLHRCVATVMGMMRQSLYSGALGDNIRSPLFLTGCFTSNLKKEPMPRIDLSQFKANFFHQIKQVKVDHMSKTEQDVNTKNKEHIREILAIKEAEVRKLKLLLQEETIKRDGTSIYTSIPPLITPMYSQHYFINGVAGSEELKELMLMSKEFKNAKDSDTVYDKAILDYGDVASPIQKRCANFFAALKAESFTPSTGWFHNVVILLILLHASITIHDDPNNKTNKVQHKYLAIYNLQNQNAMQYSLSTYFSKKVHYILNEDINITKLYEAMKNTLAVFYNNDEVNSNIYKINVVAWSIVTGILSALMQGNVAIFELYFNNLKTKMSDLFCDKPIILPPYLVQSGNLFDVGWKEWKSTLDSCEKNIKNKINNRWHGIAPVEVCNKLKFIDILEIKKNITIENENKDLLLY